MPMTGSMHTKRLYEFTTEFHPVSVLLTILHLSSAGTLATVGVVSPDTVRQNTPGTSALSFHDSVRVKPSLHSHWCLLLLLLCSSREAAFTNVQLSSLSAFHSLNNTRFSLLCLRPLLFQFLHPPHTHKALNCNHHSIAIIISPFLHSLMSVFLPSSCRILAPNTTDPFLEFQYHDHYLDFYPSATYAYSLFAPQSKN